MRLFGTDKEITTNGVKNIQRSAYESQGTAEAPNDDQLKQLFKILDYNNDNRITL